MFGRMNAQRDKVNLSVTPRRRTAVVAAMYAEIAPLVTSCTVESQQRWGGCSARIGRIGNTDVVLAWTGEGAAAAARGLRSLLDRILVDRVLGIGMAGGLTPLLESGDLVVGDRLLSGGGAVEGPDSQWLERALALGGARAGTLMTSKRMLCTAAEKAAAWAALEGSAETATVDLEGAAWAGVAGERGIPFMGLRAVCDTASEDLPFDFNQCVDQSGRISRLKVARKALLRPSAMGGLWDLRRRVAACSRQLADFTVRLLDETTT
jgi:nucleoside phosphorylase